MSAWSPKLGASCFWGTEHIWQRDGVNVGISEEVTFSGGSLLWKALCSCPVAAYPSSAFSSSTRPFGQGQIRRPQAALGEGLSW